MPRTFGLFILVFAILLVACQPTSTPTIELTSPGTGSTPRTQTQSTATGVSPEETLPDVEHTAETSPGCTVVTRRGQPTPVSAFRVIDDLDHLLGDRQAQITVIEYSDFQ